MIDGASVGLAVGKAHCLNKASPGCWAMKEVVFLNSWPHEVHSVPDPCGWRGELRRVPLSWLFLGLWSLQKSFDLCLGLRSWEALSYRRPQTSVHVFKTFYFEMILE